MGFLTEQDVFTTGVYQIEITDPVLGGPNGIANQQAKDLTNRTSWLKNRHQELFSAFEKLIGMVVPFAGSAAPVGFLLCDGKAVSRTTYAGLFAVIGTAYGVGDSSSTFNLPDLRGRIVAGLDNMGGTAANRLTTASGGVNAAVLGASGGSSTHTLTIAQMPSHNHGVTDPTHTHAVSDPGHSHSYSRVTVSNGQGSQVGTANNHIADWTGASMTGIALYGAYTGITIQNNGSGAAHPIVQPTISLNYIIKI